jgi:hypothetical protein
VKKNELKKLYNDYLVREHLQAQDAVVGFGGALVMMGLRKETSDMDLDVSPYFFEINRRRGYPMHDALVGKCIDVNDRISLHAGLPMKTVEIEGVWCYAPEILLTQKRRMLRYKGRKPEKIPQDLLDIEALEKYLKIDLPVGGRPYPGSTNDLLMGMELTPEEELFYERLLRHHWAFRTGPKYQHDLKVDRLLSVDAAKMKGNYLILLNRYRYRHRKEQAKLQLQQSA